MPRTSQNKHLKLHYNTWVFRFRWPKDTREHTRQTEFIKSLQTTNLHTAKLERDVLIADCKKVVHVLRSKDSKARQEELVLFRNRWSENSLLHDDVLQEQIFARAVDLNVSGGMDALKEEHKKWPSAPNYDDALTRLGELNSVSAYIEKATKQKDIKTTTVHYLNEWVSWRKKDVLPKTSDDGKSIVLKFADDFPDLDDVKEHDVWRYFENKRHELSVSRRKKMKGQLVSYWRFLQRNLDVPIVPKDVHPFSTVTFPQIKQSERKETWQPWPKLGEEVVEILIALTTRINYEDAWKMVFLMMYTGLRPEEAARLKWEHVHLDEGYFHIPFEDTKTSAGERDVPIHENLKDFLGLADTFGSPYVLWDLKSKNKYGIRSDPVNKKFGRFKKKLGYGRQHVLYSVRKTVITMLHQAGVSIEVIPDIVGHEHASLTLSVYSGGASMDQKRDAINKLQYPDFDHDFWMKQIP